MTTAADSPHLRPETHRTSRRRVVRSLLAVGLATVLGLFLTASPAAAASAEDFNWIQAMGRSRDCLDVPPGSAFSNGGKLQVYGCKNPGASDQWNQRWRVNYKPDKGSFEVVSSYSGLCLQASSSVFGNIEMWTCNGGDQQLWILVPSTAAPTRASGPVPAIYQRPYLLVSRSWFRATGQLYALDIPSTPGSRLQLSAWDKNAKNQAWDGFELQCAYAYGLHFNALAGACQ